MAQVMHSTKMPDGRKLDVVLDNTKTGTTDIQCNIDGKRVKFTEAVAAWDAQPYEWQRGRSLLRAIRDWSGGTAGA